MLTPSNLKKRTKKNLQQKKIKTLNRASIMYRERVVAKNIVYYVAEFYLSTYSRKRSTCALV